MCFIYCCVLCGCVVKICSGNFYRYSLNLIILKKYGNKRSVYINCNEESGRYYVDDDNGKLKDITSMVMWHNPNTCLYSTLEYLDLCTFGIDRQKTSFIESRDCV